MRRPVKLIGTGLYLPQNRVTAAEVDVRNRYRPGTALKRSGVQTRFYAGSETMMEMAAKATERALAAADCRPGELDAIIYTGSLPNQGIPCTAITIQSELGLGRSGIPCFDVNATCLGFPVALDQVAHGIVAGAYRRVLLVGAEACTEFGTADEPELKSLFGDAAFAAVVGPSPEGDPACVEIARFASYGHLAPACTLPYGGVAHPPYLYTPEDHQGYLFRMNGPLLFKEAMKTLRPFMGETLEMAGLTVDDLALIVPHQASLTALRLSQRHLKLPADKWWMIISEFGNCISCSIPMALHVAAERGRIQRGDRVMLLGTGAGLTICCTIIRY